MYLCGDISIFLLWEKVIYIKNYHFANQKTSLKVTTFFCISLHAESTRNRDPSQNWSYDVPRWHCCTTNPLGRKLNNYNQSKARAVVGLSWVMPRQLLEVEKKTLKKKKNCTKCVCSIHTSQHSGSPCIWHKLLISHLVDRINVSNWYIWIRYFAASNGTKIDVHNHRVKLKPVLYWSVKIALKASNEDILVFAFVQIISCFKVIFCST